MLRFRVAPTPSGFLHVGNAFNFILTTLLARSTGASLRLRIDDADATRARPEYLADIFETLAWLRISWDEGPCDAAEHTAQFSQNLRNARYDQTIQKLIATGEVFACNCSRKDILAASTDGQYPGTCRHKNIPLDSRNTALRLRTPNSAAVSFMDGVMGAVTYQPYHHARDPIICRRDGLPAYHIASLTDDIDYGTTHIVRGEDLLSSTAVQLFISNTLGGTPFDRVHFLHHPLLKDATGVKLSKSAGSASLRALRDAGRPVSEVYQRFSDWMRWPEVADNFPSAERLFAQHGLRGLKDATPSRASTE